MSSKRKSSGDDKPPKKARTSYLIFKEKLQNSYHTLLPAKECQRKWDLVKSLVSTPKEVNEEDELPMLYRLRKEAENVQYAEAKETRDAAGDHATRIVAKAVRSLAVYIPTMELDSSDSSSSKQVSVLIEEAQEAKRVLSAAIETVSNLHTLQKDFSLNKEESCLDTIDTSIRAAMPKIDFIVGQALNEYLFMFFPQDQELQQPLTQEQVDEVRCELIQNRDFINCNKPYLPQPNNLCTPQIPILQLSLDSIIIDAQEKLTKAEIYITDVATASFWKNLVTRVNNGDIDAQDEMMNHIAEERSVSETARTDIADLQEKLTKTQAHLAQLQSQHTATVHRAQSEASALPRRIAVSLKSQIVYVPGLSSSIKTARYTCDGVSDEVFSLAFPTISAKTGTVTVSQLGVESFSKSLRYGGYMDIVGDIKVRLAGGSLSASCSYTCYTASGSSGSSRGGGRGQKDCIVS